MNVYEHVLHHVQDATHWEFHSKYLVGGEGLVIHLPKFYIPGYGDFQITKFMLLELIAAILIIVIYVPLARKVAAGQIPRGAWWNTFEVLLTFIRSNVAHPTMADPHAHEHHHHGDEEHGETAHKPKLPPEREADKYVPYLWTLFLFILFCNLLGMIPYMGSPTGSITVTGVLAIISFIAIHGAATAKMGFVPYIKSLWPSMDLPVALFWVKPLIFTIEFIGTIIKSAVLAVRLFANMFAGHMVLGFILSFILLTNTVVIGFLGWGGITAMSLVMVLGLSLLELFVAFLQAYIFTFLTALFMGMAMHPSH